MYRRRTFRGEKPLKKERKRTRLRRGAIGGRLGALFFSSSRGAKKGARKRGRKSAREGGFPLQGARNQEPYMQTSEAATTASTLNKKKASASRKESELEEEGMIKHLLHRTL